MLIKIISHGNRSERSPIRPVIIRFVNHEYDYKQLLDEVFVISRIIKVEVRGISRSRRLRLIITISEKRRIAKLWKIGKICIKITTEEM